MRHIGHLPDEAQAQAFGDFLLAKGIRNEVERDGAAGWLVWVIEEDQVADAQSWLEKFRSNPKAPEFRNARIEAAKVREAVEQDLARYRKRVQTRQSLFPRFGGYGIGILTYALIFACVIVATFSNLGKNTDFLRYLLISDPTSAGNGFLPEVFSGEVWRLFTPIFIHFGLIHILFNMIWLFQLGCMIEGRQGSLLLAALVAVIALFSNLGEYFFSHHAVFGGMSGVVYGLAGYVWMRGKFDRASGLYLDPGSVMILLVWLVVCYSGLVGSIANSAHLVGLITGVAWGIVSGLLASSRPE